MHYTRRQLAERYKVSLTTLWRRLRELDVPKGRIVLPKDILKLDEYFGYKFRVKT